MEIHKGTEIFLEMNGEAELARLIGSTGHCNLCPCHVYCDDTPFETTCYDVIYEYLKSDTPYELVDKYRRKNK